MKILVAGYACNPVGGSEPGVGWAAVCRIARDHDVWVLTDIHNRSGWEEGRKAGMIPSNVQVRFLRDRSACSSNRFIAHIQSWLNLRDFNNRVLDAAFEWHREIGFDLCHQVTIAAWRMPSPLWRLPIPFVWGPIGGAGYIPPAFRGMLSFSARSFERVRDWQTAFTLRTKAFRDCIRETSAVFVANEETEILLKPHRGERPMFRLPIASVSPAKFTKFKRPETAPELGGPLRLFAGGNIEGRKGVSLALRALAKAKATGASLHYTIAGGGPEVTSLQNLSDSLGLHDCVTFHPGFRGEDYIKALQASDVYFLPSFRESTPVTLLEAYLAGCYPVVADTSAQGEIVRLAGGHAVPVKSIDQLIDGLADALLWCAEHRSELLPKGNQAAALVADHFSAERYDATVKLAYEMAIKAR
ncbi:MAG: glycosyltransferase family 4 protein [Luteolibacter sp.]